MAAKRLYIGRLPTDVRSEDVLKLFEGYGTINDCRVMTGFGFVEFANGKDAEDAVHNFNGKPFLGVNVVVEFAKESRPRRDPYDSERSHGAPRSRRPPGIRLLVSGISRDTSWQDLKDFGRDAGSVSFADIDRDLPGQGVLEYLNREDADRAVKELDGKDLRGRPVRVALDDSRSGADNYRRDDRREDPRRGDPRDYRRDRDDRRGDYRDSRRDDDYRSDRYNHDRYRGGRSRSPRDEYGDHRRPRSPSHKREDDKRPAGYDDYRRGGYDDSRQPNSYSDRRRDDFSERRIDEKNLGDKEVDFGERSARNANGDGNWSR